MSNNEELQRKIEEAGKLIAFGDFIKHKRLSMSKNLAEVAESIGISTNYVSELERGKKNPSDIMVRKLATYYNLDESVLFNLLGRIPLLVQEALSNNPYFNELLVELQKNKIPEEEMQEFIEELYRVWKKFFKFGGK